MGGPPKPSFRSTVTRQKLRSDHVKVVNSVNKQENGLREPLKKIDRNRDMTFSYDHHSKPEPHVEISQEFEKCDSDFIPATIIESTIISDELDSIGNLLDSNEPEKTDLYSDSLSPHNNGNEEDLDPVIVNSPPRTFKSNEDVDVISVDKKTLDIENITPNLDSSLINGVDERKIDPGSLEEKLTNGIHVELPVLEEKSEAASETGDYKADGIDDAVGNLELGDLSSRIFMKVEHLKRLKLFLFFAIRYII